MSNMLLTTDGNRIAKGILALALMAALVLPAAVFAQDKQIVDIKVAGNDHISTEAILAAMQIKPGAAFSEDAIQQAKQSIENMGYFQPGVTVGTETMGDGVRAVFTVIENPVVKEVKITGNSVVTTDKLQGLLRTSVGSVLNTDTLLQKDVKAIESYYQDQGYMAYVTEEVGIDPQTGALKIPIMEVKIEDITVAGNKKTKPYVLLREMKQKPGDAYNVKQLYSDLQRVYDLNIFEIESASSYKTEPGSDLGKVKITIPVKEKRTGEITVGMGYSSRQKLVGQAKLAENNFRGRAQKVNLLWEQSGTRGSSYEVGFYEPWLDKKNTSFGVNLYNKLIYRFASSFMGTSPSSNNNYDERHQGGSITLSRPMGALNRGLLTIRDESVASQLAQQIGRAHV
jgi:outer membrane protein insertion porin family